MLELNGELVELNCSAAGIGMDGDASRYRISQAEVIGGSHAIYQHAQVIPARNGLSYSAIVRGSRTLGQVVERGPVIEAPVDATQLSRLHHALQSFVDGITTT